MKIGKAWAWCKNERREDNKKVTAKQTRRRDNTSRWMWMDNVELDLRYVGVKWRRKRKAFDRRERTSVMREAKARHKGQYCQRIRGGGSGKRRREFKRHVICVKAAGYFNRAVWLKPREIRTKHDFPILSVGSAYIFELNFFHPDIPQAFVSISSGTEDFKCCRLMRCCVLFQNSATGLSSLENGSPLMERYSEIIEIVKTCENQPRPWRRKEWHFGSSVLLRQLSKHS